MNYKIIGLRFKGGKLVKCELYRNDFLHALIARDNMLDLGWVATIRPTPEIWTKELALPDNN